MLGPSYRERVEPFVENMVTEIRKNVPPGFGEWRILQTFHPEG
jgi:hypothetical protein